MAVIVLDNENTDDGKCMRLYMNVALRTGLPPMQVRRRIIELAGGT